MRKTPDITFSHVGLFVDNLEVMKSFYRDVLGFLETDGGEVRDNNAVFLSRDPKEHHQIVMETIPEGGVQTRVQQLSFRVPSLAALREIAELLENCDQAQRVHYVNHGNAWSAYCYDPEDNRLEFFVDTPFHVQQPAVTKLDLSLNDGEIMEATKEMFADKPEFGPREAWEDELRSRLEDRQTPGS